MKRYKTKFDFSEPRFDGLVSGLTQKMAELEAIPEIENRMHRYTVTGDEMLSLLRDPHIKFRDA